jgi:DNA-binding IclR family transcriptional regulator
MVVHIATNSEEDPPERDSGIQVIARAAAVLRAAGARPAGSSLGQIAADLDLPRSTVQRIVRALAAEGFLLSGARGGVRLGPAIAALAAAAPPDVVALCRPVLAAISRTTGETADLSALRGDGMVFLDQIAGTHRLRAVSSVGEVFPLTTPANGRACLALLPREEALRLAIAEWRREGRSGDPAAFSNHLDRIAAGGLAEDRDEHTPGISALGFAFADARGKLYAISVPVPSSRFAAARPAVAAALASARAALAAEAPATAFAPLSAPSADASTAL